jgi:hypothetical protein
MQNRLLILIFLFIVGSVTSCLKEESDLNPNIYRSGVWSSKGRYNTETQRYEADVRVQILDISTQAIWGKDTFLEPIPNVTTEPANCKTDNDGICWYLLSSVNNIEDSAVAWVETDDVADSLTQASKKSSNSTYVEIANQGEILFKNSVYVTEVLKEENLWMVTAQLSDSVGEISLAEIQLNENGSDTQPSLLSTTTDESGFFYFSLTADSTETLFFQVQLKGLTDPTQFQLEFP